jgi:hypothetical protein
VAGWISQLGTSRAAAVKGRCHLSGTFPAVISVRATSVLHFGVHRVLTMTVTSSFVLVHRLEFIQNNISETGVVSVGRESNTVGSVGMS